MKIIWTHCNVHPAHPDFECTRCRDSVSMNQRQMQTAYPGGLTQESYDALLRNNGGPFTPAEMHAILGATS